MKTLLVLFTWTMLAETLVRPVAAQLPLLPSDTNRVQALFIEAARIFAIPAESVATANVMTNMRPGRFEEFGIFNIYGTTHQLEIAARRARPFSGGNSGLASQRGAERREGKVNTNAPPRLTDGEAERLAREFVARLGVKLDETYKAWDGAWGIRSNRFHNSFRDWTYHWNRHIQGIPVWNDRVNVHIDDSSGQLISFAVYSQPFRDADAIKPVLTLEQAQRIAVKEGQRQADFNGWGRVKMTTHPDARVNRLYYYVVERQLHFPRRQQ